MDEYSVTDAENMRAQVDRLSQYYERISHYACHVCKGRKSIAEDLASETFERALSHLRAHPQKHIENPEAWLKVICKNAWKDWLGRQGRQVTTESLECLQTCSHETGENLPALEPHAAQDDEPECALFSQEERTANTLTLQQAIQALHLDAKQETMAQRFLIEGWNFHDIALMHQTSPAYVGRFLKQCCKTLKRLYPHLMLTESLLLELEEGYS